jgi:hypothetical protein
VNQRSVNGALTSRAALQGAELAPRPVGRLATPLPSPIPPPKARFRDSTDATNVSAKGVDVSTSDVGA